MVAMVKSPGFSDRAHRGLDGDFQDEGRSAPQPQARSAAEDAGDDLFVARGIRRSRRGKKSKSRRCGE